MEIVGTVAYFNFKYTHMSNNVTSHFNFSTFIINPWLIYVYNTTKNIFCIHIRIFKTPNWENIMRALGNGADTESNNIGEKS